MTALDPFPGTPLLTHPGPVDAGRRFDAHLTPVERIDVELPEGSRLLPALDAVMARGGHRSAFGELRGGTLAEFGYFIPARCTDGSSAAAFSALHEVRTPAALVRGGITIGSREGRTFSHTHALFVDDDGVRRAGHLHPESVVLGRGVRLRAVGTRTVAMTVTPDPQIGLPVFMPESVAPGSGAGTGASGARAVVARLRPNVDLVGAIQHLAERYGLLSAEVHGKIGSLVGARLRPDDGAEVVVPGPATEVMFLDGSLTRHDGRARARLSAGVVDLHGQVTVGEVVAGRNAVAMTFELALVESGQR